MRTVWTLAVAIAAVAPLHAAPPAGDAQMIVPAVPVVCPQTAPGTGSTTAIERRTPVRFAASEPRAERRSFVPKPCGLVPADPGAASRTSQGSPQSTGPAFFSYVRVGEGALFADVKYLTPAVGFGVRTELDSFAIDSSLNLQVKSNPGGGQRDVIAGSVIDLKVLRFAEPMADATIYLGGGLSWGGVDLTASRPPYTRVSGNGLQAEITSGYEFARKSAIRMFVEANAVLPLYAATTATPYYLPNSGVVETGTGHHYAPSLLLSFGVGWQRQ